MTMLASYRWDFFRYRYICDLPESVSNRRSELYFARTADGDVMVQSATEGELSFS
jgi:hypothetical protein